MHPDPQVGKVSGLNPDRVTKASPTRGFFVLGGCMDDVAIRDNPDYFVGKSRILVHNKNYSFSLSD